MALVGGQPGQGQSRSTIRRKQKQKAKQSSGGSKVSSGGGGGSTVTVKEEPKETTQPDTLQDAVSQEQARLAEKYPGYVPTETSTKNIAKNIVEYGSPISPSNRQVSQPDQYPAYTGRSAQEALLSLKAGAAQASEQIAGGDTRGVVATGMGANIAGRQKAYTQASARIDPKTGEEVPYGGGMAGANVPNKKLAEYGANVLFYERGIREAQAKSDTPIRREFGGFKEVVDKVGIEKVMGYREGSILTVVEEPVKTNQALAMGVSGFDLTGDLRPAPTVKPQASVIQEVPENYVLGVGVSGFEVKGALQSARTQEIVSGGARITSPAYKFIAENVPYGYQITEKLAATSGNVAETIRYYYHKGAGKVGLSDTDPGQFRQIKYTTFPSQQRFEMALEESNIRARGGGNIVSESIYKAPYKDVALQKAYKEQEVGREMASYGAMKIFEGAAALSTGGVSSAVRTIAAFEGGKFAGEKTYEYTGSPYLSLLVGSTVAVGVAKAGVPKTRKVSGKYADRRSGIKLDGKQDYVRIGDTIYQKGSMGYNLQKTGTIRPDVLPKVASGKSFTGKYSNVRYYMKDQSTGQLISKADPYAGKVVPPTKAAQAPKTPSKINSLLRGRKGQLYISFGRGEAISQQVLTRTPGASLQSSASVPVKQASAFAVISSREAAAYTDIARDTQFYSPQKDLTKIQSGYVSNLDYTAGLTVQERQVSKVDDKKITSIALAEATPAILESINKQGDKFASVVNRQEVISKSPVIDQPATPTKYKYDYRMQVENVLVDQPANVNQLINQNVLQYDYGYRYRYEQIQQTRPGFGGFPGIPGLGGSDKDIKTYLGGSKYTIRNPWPGAREFAQDILGSGRKKRRRKKKK